MRAWFTSFESQFIKALKLFPNTHTILSLMILTVAEHSLLVQSTPSECSGEVRSIVSHLASLPAPGVKFRPFTCDLTLTLIERAFRSRVFHRSRSFEGGFVTQRIVALPARATRHLRTRARAGRRGMTLSDGTPGNGAEATFVTWSMSFKPLFRSRPPNNDPHFPQLTDGRSAVRVCTCTEVLSFFRTKDIFVRNYEGMKINVRAESTRTRLPSYFTYYLHVRVHASCTASCT